MWWCIGCEFSRLLLNQWWYQSVSYNVPATNPIDRMLQTTRSFFAAVALGLLMAAHGIAQQTPDVPPADAPDAEAAERQFDTEAELKAFEAAVEQWRKTIIAMQQAALRFHNGTAETEQKQRDLYRELSQRGRGEFDAAVHSATRLLEREPNPGAPSAMFLFYAARYRYDRDWFELTGEAAEALIGAQIDDPKLPEIAGASFMATNQYDRAAPYLRKAAESADANDPRFTKLLETAELYRQQWEREQQLRQADAEQDDLPRVRLSTTRGDIVVELFEDQAPNTVANFIRLAEQGFYDGLLFHQVIASQIAMTGDPSGDASGHAGYRIPDEAGRSDARDTFRGSLVMAKLADPRSGSGTTLPDTASSQFFFTYVPLPWVNQEHTVFGRVIEGIGALSALTRIDPSAKKKEGEPVVVPDRVLSVEVIRKRPHPYQPEVLEGPPEAVLSQISSPGPNP